MSEFFFKCPPCGVKLETEESDIGKQALCPACGKKLRIELQTNPDSCFAPKISVQSTAPKNIESNTSTYEPEYCGWAVFLYHLATLEIGGGIILILLFAAADYGSIFAIIGGSVIFSSIFTFMGGWFAQQVYLSNELKREQISLLKEIRDKMK